VEARHKAEFNGVATRSHNGRNYRDCCLHGTYLSVNSACEDHGHLAAEAPRKPAAEALAPADDEPEPAHAANATHKEKQNAPQKEKQDDRSRPVWQHSFG